MPPSRGLLRFASHPTRGVAARERSQDARQRKPDPAPIENDEADGMSAEPAAESSVAAPMPMPSRFNISCVTSATTTPANPAPHETRLHRAAVQVGANVATAKSFKRKAFRGGMAQLPSLRLCLECVGRAANLPRLCPDNFYFSGLEPWISLCPDPGLGEQGAANRGVVQRVGGHFAD
jgi:hypothetical protein